MKKLTILALILVLVMALSACAKEEAPETTAAPTVAATAPAETAAASEPLTLSTWELGVSTWSSPNGATIHLTAAPNYYTEGQKADFVVRLEGDDVLTVPCQWDGTSYKADADLNAANGYCYYVVLTAEDGTATETAVNTPAAPLNENLINLEAALASYCSLIVEESAFSGNKLELTKCTIQVQTPVITNDGQSITCQEATLVLDCNGQILTQAVTGLTATDTAGLYEADLSGTSFEVPAMETEQKAELSVNVILSNGQSLTAYGSSWVYGEESALPVVG